MASLRAVRLPAEFGGLGELVGLSTSAITGPAARSLCSRPLRGKRLAALPAARGTLAAL